MCSINSCEPLPSFITIFPIIKESHAKQKQIQLHFLKMLHKINKKLSNLLETKQPIIRGTLFN